MSDEIKVNLGGAAPPIHEQLGVEAERLVPMQVQAQADAITLLVSSGLLTTREVERVRHRLRERIEPIIRQLRAT